MFYLRKFEKYAGYIEDTDDAFLKLKMQEIRALACLDDTINKAG